jgi:preprotein translocase subunit YajC
MQNYLLLAGETDPWASIGTIGLMVVMFVFLYFFMIRPQKKQQKEQQDMRNSLAVGDEVTTIGGIIGKVVSIKGETFVLETTKEKTHIRFLKGAVGSIDVKAEDIAKAVIEEQKAEAEATETEAK